MLHEIIKELVAILKDEDIDEIEVRRLWTTIRVAKRRTTPVVSERQNANGSPGIEEKSAILAGPLDTTPSAAPGKMEPQVNFTGDTTQLKQIVSPMVGTFYMASNTQSEPFVHEGKRVEIGEILCIIEAMKLMNEIEADTSGIIRKVLVEDSQPVEYGQPLFLVESA